MTQVRKKKKMLVMNGNTFQVRTERKMLAIIGKMIQVTQNSMIFKLRPNLQVQLG